MREERILVGTHELLIVRPDDPESLIDERRFAQDEFLPYWAELWPSGIALAQHVTRLDLESTRVLEVGCGLALPSFVACLVGAEVTASDWAPEAVELVAVNAAANALGVMTAFLPWDDENALGLGPYDLVLAADVLYEARHALPLIRLLEAVVAPGGEALIADPGRRHAAAFFGAALERGWALDRITVDELPDGGIARVHRNVARQKG